MSFPLFSTVLSIVPEGKKKVENNGELSPYGECFDGYMPTFIRHIGTRQIDGPAFVAKVIKVLFLWFELFFRLTWSRVLRIVARILTLLQKSRFLVKASIFELGGIPSASSSQQLRVM